MCTCHHMYTSRAAVRFMLSEMNPPECVQLLKRYGEHIRIDVLVRRHGCALLPRQLQPST